MSAPAAVGAPVRSRLELTDLWRPLVTVARVVVPGTLVASLFYYFGLRYTDYHYAQYGLDDAALGYSSTDYIVRSLNVMLQPARVVAVTVVLAVAAHAVVTVALRQLGRRHPAAGSAVTRVVGLALVALGTLGFFRFWSYGAAGMDPVTRTRVWLASLLALAYGLYLAWWRAGPTRRLSRLVEQAFEPRERHIIGSILLASLLVLVTYASFELTRAYARERAVQQALDTEAAPWAYPLVRIYSRHDLALDDQLGVAEGRLAGDRSAFRYRYTGLRLFIQDNGRILLWPVHRSPRHGMLILHESGDLRVEYEPQLLP